ncbi:MAG: metallophosphoesterase family protein [Pirellulaceae bacterium]
MASAIKFLHAADLHLDQPVTGLAEIPAHLKETLANAPYRAAERLFDVAISERVDFVLLAGDVVDLDQGGPRAAAFLLGQFERLADKGIEIYWCGGSVDQPDRWPNAIQLPDNVVIFPSSMVEQAAHTREGLTIATICGAGAENRKRNPSDFRCVDDAPFPIALLHGDIDTTTLAAQNIRYWALGGHHKRKVIDKTSSVAVYPGTTQSRNPQEPGGHGCTLVHVDTAGKIRLQEMELDSVRWSLQRVTVAENAKLDDLKTSLADRCSKLRSEYSDQLVLAKWRISTTGDFNPQLRSAEWHKELVNWLRNEYGQSSNSLWTVAMKIDPPQQLPADWYEEETILGDYLRSVGRFQGDASMGLSLMDYMPDNHTEDEFLTDLARISAEARQTVLQQAAVVGVEYLAQHDDSLDA